MWNFRSTPLLVDTGLGVGEGRQGCELGARVEGWRGVELRLLTKHIGSCDEQVESYFFLPEL